MLWLTNVIEWLFQSISDGPVVISSCEVPLLVESEMMSVLVIRGLTLRGLGVLKWRILAGSCKYYKLASC